MGSSTVTSSIQTHPFEQNRARPARRRRRRLAWIAVAVLALLMTIPENHEVAILIFLMVAAISLVTAFVSDAPDRAGGNVMIIGHGAQASALAAALSIEPLKPARLAYGTPRRPAATRTTEVIHIPTLDEATTMLPHLQCDRIVLLDGSATLAGIPPDARGIEPKIVGSGSELQRILGRVPLETLIGNELTSESQTSSAVYRFAKRALDILAVIPLSLVFVMVLPVLWLAIRLDSPGPVFYSQTRIGLDGKRFRIHKFRTMCQDAEAHGAAWATTDDPRVTSIGRIMRATRIDELPQIWNLILGNMTLIGPRPERPEFSELIEKQLPAFAMRTRVKPGITGWAQICAGYGRSVDDARTKLEYDLFYVAHASVRFDMKILLNTIPVVVGRKGS